MFKQLLQEGWTVRPVSNLENVPAKCQGVTPANVPGCVHTDLLRDGKIPDPYYNLNEPTLRWIGQTDWRFETSFIADEKLFEHERIDLAADGLDTVATIELNGREIAKTANMHVGYRFDVKPHLKPGKNTLAITFASAEHYAYAMEKRLGKLPYLNNRVPFNMIRKMACNFGWDWGPEFITCGIWRGIRLEGWSDIQILADRTSIRFEGKTAIVDCDVHVDGLRQHPGRVDLLVKVTQPDGQVIQGRDSTDAHVPDRFGPHIEIANPQLWWPIGHGSQPLYKVEMEFRNEQGKLVASTERRIGLRTVELDTSPDDIGRAFTIKVNGKPIFCKGFNWIPDDCFHDRACSPERYRTRIQQAVDANANMLRVWGGGIYESNDFYDICDEMGVLVWQDFLFACAAYSEEEPIRSLVEEEVRYNVTRLSHHASLVLWNGCNENVWGYHDWGWKLEGLVKGRTWGPGYYFDLLPKWVAELDPSRPYWAASPWSGDTDVDNGLYPNLASHGNKHAWDVWCQKPASAYRNFTPRFCSEFGFQAPPAYATLAEALPADQRVKGSPGMAAHQKHPSGDGYNAARLAESFDEVKDFDDWLYLLQLNQARGVQTGVEWFRANMPVCMGAVYWQLNDCWPVNSWSAIDSAGRLKPLWYATRRFFAPRLLTIHRKQDEYELCAVNDTDEPWNSPVELTIYHVNGEVKKLKTRTIDAASRTVQRIPLRESDVVRPQGWHECLAAVAGDVRTVHFFDLDRLTYYPKPQFTAAVEHRPGETRLTINAKVVMRDVLIQADRIDPQATVNDNLVTLLPGESFTFAIKSEVKMTKEQLTTQPVMNLANRFGRKSE